VLHPREADTSVILPKKFRRGERGGGGSAGLIRSATSQRGARSGKQLGSRVAGANHQDRLSHAAAKNSPHHAQDERPSQRDRKNHIMIEEDEVARGDRWNLTGLRSPGTSSRDHTLKGAAYLS